MGKYRTFYTTLCLIASEIFQITRTINIYSLDVHNDAAVVLIQKCNLLVILNFIAIFIRYRYAVLLVASKIVQ